VRRLPKYKADISYIIGWDEFKRLFNTATTYVDKSVVTVCWITGARPAEIMELRKRDVKIGESIIEFHLKTMKLGNKGKFIVRSRTLRIRTDTNKTHIRVLGKHLKRLKDDDTKLFRMSRKTFNNIIERLGYDALNVKICPYNFRHSRMTLLAEMGKGRGELMRFKGARSERSVYAYDHARKVDYDVDVDI